MSELATAMRTIVVEREMPHPPEKIWRALTQAPLIEVWLMKNDFQPIVGHRFNFRAVPVQGWNGVTDCEVLEVTPHRRLVYSWNASGDQAAWPEDNRDLDADAARERNACPDGTVRLSAAGRSWLPRHGRRLAAPSRKAGGRRLPVLAIELEAATLLFGVAFGWLAGSARGRDAVSPVFLKDGLLRRMWFGPRAPRPCEIIPRIRTKSLPVIGLASCWRVCWDGFRLPDFPRRLHVASDRLLFLASIAVGLYRAQIVPGGRQYL